MSVMQDSNVVKEQYKNGVNLQTRISIHEKYSVNKKGFGNWIFEHYTINEKYRILELGCGNGDMWRNHINDIPKETTLILTDFSKGMLSEAKTNIPQSDNILFKQVDIQNIPFNDDSFDIIIANMMLYHVPDLNKALSEIKRVLKNEGTFYCATYGEHGIAGYIQDLLNDYGVDKNLNKVFTLQNGEEILDKHFSSIQRSIYEDHLEVTNTEDLIEYVFSLTSMIDFNKLSKDELRVILDNEKVAGKIIIPKEYGMFIVKK
ncbi:class I SAM-dependent methyltransferase [Clostridium amazonitimonense]|uniref:class I SAM-dependent methyltransferase n=1 Tax=Clostridium amazonitimonense TaxID=1499689 RepID=UPI00068B9781|nr:class I SAM-dependent methyltransferase [Clostridium amazonitimonense]